MFNSPAQDTYAEYETLNLFQAKVRSALSVSAILTCKRSPKPKSFNHNKAVNMREAHKVMQGSSRQVA